MHLRSKVCSFCPLIRMTRRLVVIRFEVLIVSKRLQCECVCVCGVCVVGDG